MSGLLTTEVTAPPNLYPGFINLALRALVAGTRAPCAIRLETFNANLNRLSLVIALDKGQRISDDWRKNLLESEVSNVYLTLAELEEVQEYLHSHTQKALQEGLDANQGHFLVYESALCTIKSAMLEPRNGRRLGLGVKTVRDLVDTIYEDETARSGLLRVIHQNRQIYTHSLNVCLLGVGFARSLGWPKDQLETLGVALFFHDLGLVEGGLDEDGWPKLGFLGNHEDVIQHPRTSVRFLKKVPGVSDASLDIVLNHHENLEGSGFPRGLRNSQLTTPERLARIVDFYEAQTSGYGMDEPVSPFEALSHMRGDLRHKLDQALLEKFVRFLGQV